LRNGCGEAEIGAERREDAGARVAVARTGRRWSREGEVASGTRGRCHEASQRKGSGVTGATRPRRRMGPPQRSDDRRGEPCSPLAIHGRPIRQPKTPMGIQPPPNQLPGNRIIARLMIAPARQRETPPPGTARAPRKSTPGIT